MVVVVHPGNKMMNMIQLNNTFIENKLINIIHKMITIIINKNNNYQIKNLTYLNLRNNIKAVVVIKIILHSLV
jgi:hypothetical protein